MLSCRSFPWTSRGQHGSIPGVVEARTKRVAPISGRIARAPHPAWRTLYRWVPALDSLREYTPTTFRRDLLAGLTVAAVAVPQAMAYASIFGMPVEYGLYTAMVMTAVGAIFDSSKQLINGPTNAISIAMLSALAGTPDEARIPAAILMAFLIGAIQLGITFLRLGDLSRYISHAVIVGFTAGASVLLVLDQLKHALGLKAMGSAEEHFIRRFWMTVRHGGPVHYPTLLLTLGTIAVAMLIRWLNRRWGWKLPELLLAIGAAGLAVGAMHLGDRGVRLVEQIPRTLPQFQPPAWDLATARALSTSALAIALLGLLEAIAMSKSIAAKTRQKLDINQQCLSEGLANVAGSFFHCFPGSGSLTRSYINHQSGAATQWSGVFSAAAVALTVLLFAPAAQYVPRAALAGVLLLTATRMIDLPGLRYHLRATTFDAVIVAATALSAVLISVEFCILIGTGLSFLMYLPRAASVEMTEMVRTKEGLIREQAPHEAVCDRIRLYNFEGELFFGSAPDFERLLERIERQCSGTARFVVLRIKHLRNPDAVCMDLLTQFIDRIESQGITVVLSGVRDSFHRTLQRSGVVERLGESRVFRELSQVWSSTSQAVEWAYEHLGQDFCEICPRRSRPEGTITDWHFMI